MTKVHSKNRLETVLSISNIKSFFWCGACPVPMLHKYLQYKNKTNFFLFSLPFLNGIAALRIPLVRCKKDIEMLLIAPYFLCIALS